MKTILHSIILLSLFISFGLATTINVPAEQPTIQAGIDAATNGDTVLVADSTYYENIDFKGKAITVASHFLINGDSNHIDSTIIDGSQPSHPDSGSVVRFISGEDTTSVLCGFTITGGSGTYFASINRTGGGGIIMMSGGKIIHNKITNNHINVVTQQEIGGGGLAFASMSNTNLIVEYNEITHNSIVGPANSNGGGLWIGPSWNDGFIRVNTNLISNNSVTCTGTYKAMGGGIGVSLNLPTKGTILIKRNLISNNELHCVASVGAGIYIVYWHPANIITDENPCPVVRNNIISENVSEDLGGGIGVWTVEYGSEFPNSDIKPQPAIINNSFAYNVAQDGCGIFSFDSYPLLMNNILWNDLSASGSNEIFDRNINFSPYVPPYHDPINDGEVFVRYSDVQGGYSGTGNVNADPLFADTILYNLTDSSKCIGWGTDSIQISGTWYYAPSIDYDGDPRPNPVDNFVDMGAQESDFSINEIINKNPYYFPKIFSLSQNYPNPFNPSTKIKYTLPKSEKVKIEVFNLLGQKIKTLLNKQIPSGSHEVEFNDQNLSSGVYLYRIEAGDYQEVKKMILLK